MLRGVSPADDPFLYQVFKDDKVDEFAALGWSKPQVDAHQRMQFEALKLMCRSRYPAAVHYIIGDGDARIGHLVQSEDAEAIVLVYMALLPPFRNRGIGTQLLVKLQRAAYESDKPLRLHVLELSPARRLYERLGFQQVDHSVPCIAMEWNSLEVAR